MIVDSSLHRNKMLNNSSAVSYQIINWLSTSPPMKIDINKKLVPSGLLTWLHDHGYHSVQDTHEAGDFSHHGDTVRIFPVDLANPLRLSFFGNQLESIIKYDLFDTKYKLQIDDYNLIPNILIANSERFLPGDYVVHIDHGIGIFHGLGLKKVEDKESLFIFIDYDKKDKLYVPLEYAEKVSRYLGVGNRRPKLSRLGSVSWQNTKKRVFESVIKLAKELLVVAARREVKPGISLKGNPEWQAKLSQNFPFTETPDQQRAIDDVQSDMKKAKPMDRLIVGDVGFGKTEVALRALLQAVSSGYQVAFLAPTTLLVEQHYLNFKARLEELPLHLTKLSRLTESGDNKAVITGLKNGQVDAVVGTHRLLGKDITFNKLGLLIIDEEQKFGVAQKEKLKTLKETIDVLTLSATPIPRTLFISLSGLRDISKIDTPPRGRLPIETQVDKHSDDLVIHYIKRELSRGGQVFYLHNNVTTIGNCRDKLQKLLPKGKITVAHGQMEKELLSQNMTEFAAKKYDILVCSTIIENGLDLPNVNTLIVEEADRFGLSDLYQIRGRIGRSERQAYALFTVNNKELTVNALKRLRSLAENTALGSGFQIALHDLEIRGGGNVLGREQHGNMEAVGLVLYTRLLEQAVKKLK